MTETRALRIGIVLGGRIVEERVLRPPASVSIGSSSRCTLVVPGSTLPARLALFDCAGGQFRLLHDEGTEGRVSLDDGGPLSLAQARARRGATPLRGGRLALPLGRRARGKLALGEVTVLYQLVTPPPAPPRPRLPPSIRGGLLGRVDWTLAASFVALVALHGGALAYLGSVELPARVEAGAIPEGFLERVPVREPPRVVQIGAIPKVGPAPLPKVRRSGGREGGARGRGGPAAGRVVCDRECLKHKVENLLIGHRGGPGAAIKKLLDSDPGNELARALRGVRGDAVAQRGPGGLATKGDDDARGRAKEIDDLAPSGPGEVRSGEAAPERAPTVQRGPVKVDDDKLRPVDVEQTIRNGMRAVTACYERELRRNPGLGGKAVVRLVVSPTGGVSQVDFESDSVGSPRFTACVASHARRWRFPPPGGKAGAEVSVPILFRAAERQ
jgi:TonB family protein